MFRVFLISLICTPLVASPSLGGDKNRKRDWSGAWETDRGRLELSVVDNAVEGSYGGAGGKVTGTRDGARLDLRYESREGRGRVRFELDAQGQYFMGRPESSSGRRGVWRGWRKTAAALEGPRASVDGHWRTTYGVTRLRQTEGRIEGAYGAEGWGRLAGSIEGRRMTLRYESPFGKGELWAELTPDGRAWYGSGTPGGKTTSFGWLGQRLEGFEVHTTPKPGELRLGITENKMLYQVRAPQSWKADQPSSAIVFLHGSNSSARPYLESLASQWPEIGAEYLLIGIEGEQWEDTSPFDSPVNNYTYINWMGKSTYEGYPHTDRESPALVAEATVELRKAYSLSRVFIGGHSQGGYLTYILYMHFPELFEGAFPMSCGLVIQAEPDVFDKPELLAAQRANPLAILHAKNDRVVEFGSAEYALRRFREFGFPARKLFSDDTAAHRFSHLPVDDAIAWLSALSTDDGVELATFAQRSYEQDERRDVVAALRRGRRLELDEKSRKLLAELEQKIDRRIGKRAHDFVRRIRAAKDDSWVEAFYEFREEFEFAPSARAAMDAFHALRSEHEGPARALRDEARRHFQRGERAEGYALYEKIVAKYYASSVYVAVKKSLARR